jgi:hypothetical protein
MGEGAIVQDGVNCIVIPHFEVDALAAAKTEIAETRQKQVEFGKTQKHAHSSSHGK